MKTMTKKEAKNSFELLMETVQKEPVLLTKRNKAVGVFLSIKDIESIPELKRSLFNKVDKQISNPLLPMLGASKNNQSFASPQEADKFITERRNKQKKLLHWLKNIISVPSNGTSTQDAISEIRTRELKNLTCDE